MPRLVSLLLLSCLFLVTGCATTHRNYSDRYSLVEVAHSDRQWTGISVAPDGGIFVNYPRWSDNVPFSVGALRGDGTVSPYPDMETNRWAPGVDPASHFVCVQSVVFDSDGFLWVLDPANPKFQGVVAGGAKLVKIDLANGRTLQTVRFAPPVITNNSYLNDVRIDTSRKTAYITDSGSGAIIVVDLASGGSRRLLGNDRSTRSEGTILTIERKPWRRPDGSVPQIHSDGIALDREGKYLYYHALTGRTLYRIATKWLRDPEIGDAVLAGKVENLGETGAAEGMEFGPDGKVYVTALEENGIKGVVAGEKPHIVVQSSKLAWPDTLAFGPDGTLYVTTSQIHRGPHPPEPYRIYKVVKE
jgi:sugar lactone lactonase YvrE